MVENKKIEQDLREIDIRIKNLKIKRNCEVGKFALYSLSNGALMTFVRIPSPNIALDMAILISLGSFNMYNSVMNLVTIVEKNEQIKNLKYLKKYIQSYDISKIDIDKLKIKIESMNEKDYNKSNLEFLKHYLENSSLSHDDMEYKELAKKSK